MVSLVSASQAVAIRMRAVLETDGQSGLSLDELSRLTETKAGAGVSRSDIQAYLAQHDGVGPGQWAQNSRLGGSEATLTGMFSPETVNAMLDELSGGKQPITTWDMADRVLVQKARDGVFQALDEDQSGGLSAQELSAAGAGAAASAARELADQLDANGDEQVSQHEADAARLLTSQRMGEMIENAGIASGGVDPVHTLAEWLRPQLDIDHDGELTLGEYATATGRRAEGCGLAARADGDRDGKLNEQELASLLQGFDLHLAVAPLGGAAAKSVQSSVLQGSDKDGDAALSRTELTASLSGAEIDAVMSFDADGDGRLQFAEVMAELDRGGAYYRDRGISGRVIKIDEHSGRVDLGTAAELALHKAIWRTQAALMDNYLTGTTTSLEA